LLEAAVPSESPSVRLWRFIVRFQQAPEPELAEGQISGADF
jgi:hypothetical protein